MLRCGHAVLTSAGPQWPSRAINRGCGVIAYEAPGTVAGPTRLGLRVEALPGLLGRLEADWSIKVGGLFPNATEAFVSEAVTTDGQSVALKIPIAGLTKA